MDEMEIYRAKLSRKWDRRVTRREKSGRRISDYREPKFWTWGFITQFFALIIGGAVLLLIAGCVAIKKAVLGG